MRLFKTVPAACMLGAVTALLSAVVPALAWRNLPPASFDPTPRHFTYWTYDDDQLMTWGLNTRYFGAQHVNVLGTGPRETVRENVLIKRASVPSWVDVPRDVPGYTWTGEGYGWPFVALTANSCDIFGSWGTLDGVKRPNCTFRVLGSNVTMPTRVYWPGALANFFVFVIAWALLLHAPSEIRTRLRLRRGQCLKCGYDVRTIGGGVCPECGEHVSVNRRAAAVGIR